MDPDPRCVSNILSPEDPNLFKHHTYNSTGFCVGCIFPEYLLSKVNIGAGYVNDVHAISHWLKFFQGCFLFQQITHLDGGKSK